MNIHRFELDVSEDEIDKESSTRYFFFHDKTGTLSTWKVRASKKKLLITAYQELIKGYMEIVEIKEVEISIQSIQIDTQGVLLLFTAKGCLKLELKTKNINIKSSDMQAPEDQRWSNDSLQFPGMKITYQTILNKQKLIKYTTSAIDHLGDPFLEESILCMSVAKNKSPTTTYSRPFLLIGHSRLDTELNLVEGSDKKIFDIPLTNFSINSFPRSNKLELIGWNRSKIQAVEISCEQIEENIEPIRIIDKCSRQLEDAVLKEQSTLYNDNVSQLVILVDKTQPYIFYLLDKHDKNRR